MSDEKKTVPVPSVGRIVLYAPKVGGMMGEAWAQSKAYAPAVIVKVDPKDPRKVQLLPLVAPSAWVGNWVGDQSPVLESTYGENVRGGWWWPPRVDATMEV